ncbi:restriction endonuclease subunit S [Erysipelotrichaceae bacterium HCN-30851]
MTEKSSKPQIRFAGFNDTWEQRKFDEVFDCTIPNNTLSRAELNYENGSVKNIHYGDILIRYGSIIDVQNDEIPFATGKSIDDFKGALLQDGDIVIADTAEDETTGKACEIGNSQGVNVVSGLHTMVCRPRNKMASGYLGYYLNSDAYHHQFLPLMQGIKVLSLSKTNVQKTTVCYPKREYEQQLIADYFRNLDNLITLHQHKYDKLINVKKSMLEKMFPKNGSNVPEIRFKGFTKDWEQRKVSDMFRVTRGYVLAATLTEEVQTNEMPYPVYSSQTKDNGLLGYYKDFLYEDAITWTTDGANAGTVNYRAGKFYCTNVCGVLLSNEVKASKMIAEALNNVAKSYVSYVGNPKLMNNVVADIEIMIPVSPLEQEKISNLFAVLDNLITLHQCELEKLQNIKKACLEKMFVCVK